MVRSNRSRDQRGNDHEVYTVVKTDSGEMIVRHSTVVKKDSTSCDIVHDGGSSTSRSEINGETITRCSTIVKTGKSTIFVDVGSTNEASNMYTPEYKSKNTTSLSCRVQVAYTLSVQYGYP